MLSIFISCVSFAQTNSKDVDPFLGHHTLGGHADLVLFNTQFPYNKGFEIGYDFFSHDSVQMPVMNTVSNNNIYSCDGVSGNFLMGSVSDQARDEAVCGTMESVGDSSMIVKLYVAQMINGMWTVSPFTIDSVKFMMGPSSSFLVRMTSGYFDGGPAKEFAIAYCLPDSVQMIMIRVFKLDSITYRPIEITSIRNVQLPSTLTIPSESWPAGGFFDIAAGDFDGDGLDEIVLANNNAPFVLSGSNGVVLLSFHAYDFDWTSKNLVTKGVMNLSWNVLNPFYYHYNKSNLAEYNFLDQLVLKSGDFNGDGRAECVCGFSTVWSYLSGGTPLYFTDSYVEPFSLSEDLTTFGFNNNSTSVDEVRESNDYYQFATSMSLATGDLDQDGKDELVEAGKNYLKVNKLSDELSLTAGITINCFTKTRNWSHHRIAITDIDGDTTFADTARSKWYPEIVTSEFSVDPNYPNNTLVPNNYNQLKVYKDTGSVNIKLNLVSNLVNYSDTLYNTLNSDEGILPAYLRGNAIRMGKPYLKTVKNVVEPAIILNAPPIHFDVINDSSYDICNSYPIVQNGNSLFYSQLVQSSTHEAEVTTNVHSSWGVSAALSGGGSFLGKGASASLTAKYGKDFSNTQRIDSTMTTTQTDLTTWDDLIYATVTSYDIWEYPVYAYGIKKGDVMAAIAHPQTAKWFRCNDGNYGNSIILDHEPGNLLSYPTYSAPSDNPDMGSLIYAGDSYSISPTGSPSSWELNWQKITQSSAETASSYGFAASASVEGWGVKLETEGNYDHSDINTHTTTVTQNVDMTANLGKINPLYASAGYNLQPYAYWSKSGPLVLNYMVDLPTSGVFSFWEDNYSQKPDLTFNCYYRYFSQKGLFSLKPEMADWTKEISISPETPKQGDTVTVSTKIHNYSLKTTSGPVQVRFYLGSSETGGRIVAALNGDTVFSTSSPVAARGDQTLQFQWKIPSGLTSSDSILYALIDPDNNISELKKDNNVGWNRISIMNVTSVRPTKSNQISSYILSQNYPNPFNPVTRINYQIPKLSHVTIKVYNILGQEIATLVNAEKMAGHYSVEFNATNFASGVYLYRMQAGSFVSTKKLILLK